MEIKICGIRRKEDIAIVNRYQPDYIGFVFANSKRQVTPSKAVELTKQLDKRIRTVGVFVNETEERVLEIAKTCGLDIVQLHGDETKDTVCSIAKVLPVWKAIRIKEDTDIFYVEGAERVLLDKYKKEGYGGYGETFDWNQSFTIKQPIVLAGGITKDNVKEGIKRFSPVCIDVSSSVETDGCKDEQKIRELIEVVRNE